MNFTLHFRLARRDLGAPAAAVGAMLPDLWRMAHRHVRPVPGAIDEGQSPRVTEVMAGVAHHGRADAAFHTSASFREGERAMTKALAAIGAPRLSLFGHIAWELCLDGALVRREGAALGSEVRDGIACALELTGGESAADAAARIHHAARKKEPLPVGFEERVGRMLAELGRGRWIEGYARGEVVAERLDGIRGRLGFESLDAVKREALAAVLEEAIGRAGGEIETLLEMRV
jgi:hypothetical protein